MVDRSRGRGSGHGIDGADNSIAVDQILELPLTGAPEGPVHRGSHLLNYFYLSSYNNEVADPYMHQNKPLTVAHAHEVNSGERFQFGRNWSKFLKSIDKERITQAEESLKQMLGVESLRDRSFPGLSFDYDPFSCASTAELRRRYFPEDGEWRVEQGSVLDKAYLASFGQFDIVYSWESSTIPGLCARLSRM